MSESLQTIAERLGHVVLVHLHVVGEHAAGAWQGTVQERGAPSVSARP